MAAKRKPKPILGRPPLPKGERKVPLHVLIDPALLAELREVAESSGDSQAVIVSGALRVALTEIRATQTAKARD